MISDRKLRAPNSASGNANIGMSSFNTSHNGHGSSNANANANANSGNNSSTHNAAHNSSNSSGNHNHNHNQHYNGNANNRSRANANASANPGSRANSNEQRYVAINGFNGDVLQNVLGNRFKAIEHDRSNCIYKGISVLRAPTGSGTGAAAGPAAGPANNHKKKPGMDLLSELNRSFK